MDKPRIAYAGNRQLGVRGLELMIEAGCPPVVLLLPRAIDEHTSAMKGLVRNVPVLLGTQFRSAEGIDVLSRLGLDYILSIHFPFMFPTPVLALPKLGSLNLHPAYLPFNRGWHTPSWALLERTRCGATLHWMDAGIDTGAIALQEALEVQPDDTAHTLYQRILALEEKLLIQSVPLIIGRSLPRVPQPAQGTYHSKEDLQRVQLLDASETMAVGQLIDRLRALTTNNWSEAARFRAGDKTYAVRIEIKRLD